MDSRLLRKQMAYEPIVGHRLPWYCISLRCSTAFWIKLLDQRLWSVCNATVHLAATNAKICNCDPIKLDICNDHLSLSKNSKSVIESHRSSELNETQNHCETKVSNQPKSFQISHVIIPDMIFPNDSHISDEISYKSEEKKISEVSNLDVISYTTNPHDTFASCGKLVHCEEQVLNELDFDYNLDDCISTAVYP
ncbi:unnamed protein product [Schistosoma margrebowiei]|uniref:Uncharacterized protein n=1 Tax=Schistosoma margrebowiei TaxID=48269 RepID=A0A183N2B3_9TREM|nr:unnamed protein product [Schistosoma margrebowiei]